MFQLIQKTGNYNVCKLNSRKGLIVHSWPILRIVYVVKQQEYYDSFKIFLCLCWPKLS